MNQQVCRAKDGLKVPKIIEFLASIALMDIVATVYLLLTVLFLVS